MKRQPLVCLLGFFAMGAPGFSQPAPPPAPAGPKLNTRAAIEGSDTIRGYRLSLDAREVLDPAGQVLMRLPLLTGMPELMGMLQQGSDLELFLRLDDRSP